MLLSVIILLVNSRSGHCPGFGVTGRQSGSGFLGPLLPRAGPSPLRFFLQHVFLRDGNILRTALSNLSNSVLPGTCGAGAWFHSFSIINLNGSKRHVNLVGVGGAVRARMNAQGGLSRSRHSRPWSPHWSSPCAAVSSAQNKPIIKSSPLWQAASGSWMDGGFCAPVADSIGTRARPMDAVIELTAGGVGGLFQTCNFKKQL